MKNLVTPDQPKKINYWFVPFLGMAIFSVVFVLCWRSFWYGCGDGGIFRELSLNPLWIMSSGTGNVIYHYPGPLFISAAIVIPMCAATTTVAIAAQQFKMLVASNIKAIDVRDADLATEEYDVCSDQLRLDDGIQVGRRNLVLGNDRFGENPVERESGKD